MAFQYTPRLVTVVLTAVLLLATLGQAGQIRRRAAEAGRTFKASEYAFDVRHIAAEPWVPSKDPSHPKNKKQVPPTAGLESRELGRNVFARAKKATSNTTTPLGTFCDYFSSQCSADISTTKTYTSSCKYLGNTSYGFSCEQSGTQYANDILDTLANSYIFLGTGGESLVTTHTTTSTETVHVTKKVVSTSTDATKTKTTTKSKTSTKVIVVPRKTKTVTTAIPETSTKVKLITTTTTKAKTSVITATAKAKARAARAVRDVTPSLQKRAGADFCSTYPVACDVQCYEGSSTVKSTTCDANASPTYKISCVCADGNDVTQDALAAMASLKYYTDISKFATSTVFKTKPVTTTATKTSLSILDVTLTTILPVTRTKTTSKTSTASSTSTVKTGRKSVLATKTLTSYITVTKLTTKRTTTTQKATSTKKK